MYQDRKGHMTLTTLIFFEGGVDLSSVGLCLHMVYSCAEFGMLYPIHNRKGVVRLQNGSRDHVPTARPHPADTLDVSRMRYQSVSASLLEHLKTSLLDCDGVRRFDR